MNNKNSVYLDKVSKSNKAFNINKEEQLLLEAPKESYDVLNRINLTHHLSKIDKKVNQINKIKHFKNLFDKNVYLGSDIKKLCNTYDLKLCKAEYFLCEINSELNSKLNEFIDQQAIYEDRITDIDEYYYENGEKKVRKFVEKVKTNKSNIMITSRNFFILAPSENFINDKSKLQNATLFYRDHDDSNIAHENDHFIEIYSWGENYSESRMSNFLYNNYYYKFKKEKTSIRTAKYNYLGILLLFFIINTYFNVHFSYLLIISALLLILFIVNILDFKNLIHTKTWNQNNFSEV